MPAVYIFSIYLAIDMWSQYVYSRATSGRAPQTPPFSGTDTAAFRDACARLPCPPCPAHGHQVGPSFQSSQKASKARCRSSKTAARGGPRRAGSDGAGPPARRSRDPYSEWCARALADRRGGHALSIALTTARARRVHTRMRAEVITALVFGESGRGRRATSGALREHKAARGSGHNNTLIHAHFQSHCLSSS